MRPELRAAKVLWIVGLGPAPLPAGKFLPLHVFVEHTHACHLLHACLFVVFIAIRCGQLSFPFACGVTSDVIFAPTK